ncbi:MAG TPA: hypothetical protein VLZ76_02690 [Lysobacter sp.]|jgi:hypothetical protein|nr:hypothetical protein [Lysobacter sp.]
MIDIRFLSTVVLGLAGLLVAPSAQAEKKVMVADCEVGGCRCMLSATTVMDIETLTGEAAPPGAAGMTLVVAFDDMVWSPKTPKELHRIFGGSGDCPIELFPSTGNVGGPRDGIWVFEDHPADMSRCPLMKMGNAIAGVEVDGPEGGDVPIRWRGQFHPDKYFPKVPGALRWVRIDDRNWRGELDSVNGTAAADIVSVVLHSSLVRDDLIRGSLSYRSNMDKLMKDMPQIAPMYKCEFRTEYTGRWKSGF